jgi:hypothetical protein
MGSRRLWSRHNTLVPIKIAPLFTPDTYMHASTRLAHFAHEHHAAFSTVYWLSPKHVFAKAKVALRTYIGTRIGLMHHRHTTSRLLDSQP